MDFLKKIRAMDPSEIAKRPEVKALWEKSLLSAVAHRRGTRYPLGVSLPEEEDCWMPFQSKSDPVPLDEVELAILCWAGAGTSGIIKNDVPYVPYTNLVPTTVEGRVFPSACNLWYHHLIFCNDDGVFLYVPHVPTKLVEIDTQKDMEVIFRAFKEGVIQISDQPVRIPPDLPWPRGGANFLFKPGTTNFIPVADNATDIINTLLGSNSRPKSSERTYLLDDEDGDIPALRKWVDNGYLKHALRIPQTRREIGGFLFRYYSLATMTHNIQMCATSMGLGNFLYGAANRLAIMGAIPTMKGLGFRFVKDKKGDRMAVGIDGLIESHHPPYMSVDEAVDDVWNMKFKPGYGRFSVDVKEGDEVMYPGFSNKPRAVHRPYRDIKRYFAAFKDYNCPEAVQITKDTLNYLYDKYGRFVKMDDPMRAGTILQISHVEVDFYDKYYPKDVLTDEQREHISTWHE